MRLGVLLIATLALAAAATGCRKPSDAPSCAAIANQFMAIARTDMSSSGLDEAVRRGVDAQLPAMRDALLSACSDGHWSEAVRRCLAVAASHVEFEACEAQLDDAQRRALTP